MIRSFIAIDLESAARARLGDIQGRLKRALETEPVRWVRAEGIHLTLKFLGDQTASRLEQVKALLVNHAREGRVYRLAIVGIGCFPNTGNPRVIWAGLQEPSEHLASWADGLDALLADLGIERERRAFQPHLTLGRFKARPSPQGRSRLESEIVALEKTAISETLASNVDLMRSDLRPEGPSYTILARVPLGSGDSG